MLVHPGALQSSISEPLITLVYVNDLKDIVLNHSLLHAEELKIWTMDSLDILQKDIISKNDRSISLEALINDIKSAYMLFRQASIDP